MKRGTPEHPKTRRLARLLDLEDWGSVGILERLWHFTSKHAIRGDLGKWSDEEIAEAIGWRRQPASKLIEALLKAGWLDPSSRYRLLIHDWHDHAEESVKKTVKNRGETFATLEDGEGRFLENGGVFPENSGKVNLAGETFPSQPKPKPKPKPKPSHSLSQSQSQQPSPTAGGEAGFRTLADLWNGIPNVKRCEAVTKKRLAAYRERIADPWWCEHCAEALAKVAGSLFCQGQGRRQWFASIDWLLRPDSVAKLVEGQYDDCKAAQPAGNGEGRPMIDPAAYHTEEDAT